MFPRRTTPEFSLLIIRILASIPLIAIGAQHLIGTAPMQPILEGAGFPLVAFFALLVPILEVIVGLAMAIGIFARVGAIVTVGIMAGAVYAHLQHDWQDEPVILLPLGVMIGALIIVWRGAGAFSADLAASR